MAYCSARNSKVEFQSQWARTEGDDLSPLIADLEGPPILRKFSYFHLLLETDVGLNHNYYAV